MCLNVSSFTIPAGHSCSGKRAWRFNMRQRSTSVHLVASKHLFEAPVHDLQLFLGKFCRLTQAVEALRFIASDLYFKVICFVICSSKWIVITIKHMYSWYLIGEWKWPHTNGLIGWPHRNMAVQPYSSTGTVGTMGTMGPMGTRITVRVQLSWLATCI